jgi:hypothetical protein
MLLFALVLLIIGWMLLYAGFTNRGIKEQVLWAFGNRTA